MNEVRPLPPVSTTKVTLRPDLTPPLPIDIPPKAYATVTFGPGPAQWRWNGEGERCTIPIQGTAARCELRAGHEQECPCAVDNASV